MRRDLRAVELDGVLGARPGRRVRQPVFERRGPPVADVFGDPAGMGQRLGEQRRLEAEGRPHPVAADIGKTVPDVALALGMHRHIDGQHQRLEPRIGSTADQVLRDRAVARRVELVPGVVRRDPRRGLQRVVARPRHDVGDVGLGRGLGQHHVGAAAEEPGAAGRRDAERARIGAAEDRLRLVALGYVDEIARQEIVLVKRRRVAVQPALVFEPALDKVERDLRQPPLGHAVQIFDVDGLVDPHRAGFSL